RRRRRVALVPDGRIRQELRQIRRHWHCRSGLQHPARSTGDPPVTHPFRSVTPAPKPTPFKSAEEAEHAIARLNAIMERLETLVSEETARVRAGQLRAAVELDEEKVELAR